MYACQCATKPLRDAEFAFQSEIRIAATFKSQDCRNAPTKFIARLLPASVKDIVPDPLLVDRAINRLSQLGFRPTRRGKLSVSACANVISAGGVFIDNNGAMQASNYATAFHSKIYPGRSVPDFCGLVWMLPHASFIALRRLTENLRTTTNG